METPHVVAMILAPRRRSHDPGRDGLPMFLLARAARRWYHERGFTRDFASAAGLGHRTAGWCDRGQGIHGTAQYGSSGWLPNQSALPRDERAFPRSGSSCGKSNWTSCSPPPTN